MRRAAASAVLAALLLAVVLPGSVSAATIGARAFVVPLEQYLGGYLRPMTLTVRNNGTVGLGAVDIQTPDVQWQIQGCGGAPAGWSTVAMIDRCRFTSGAGAGDDIAPGAGRNFNLSVGTYPGTQDRSGNWTVLVSRTSNFSVPADIKRSDDPQSQLRTTAYSLQIMNAVFTAGPAAAGSPCPAPGAAPLAGSGGHTLVICGRNRTNNTITPKAQFATLEGNFIAAHGGFVSGPVPRTSDSRVLGYFTNVTITSHPYANNLVVPRVAATLTQTSPFTPLDGYAAGVPTNMTPVASGQSVTTSEDTAKLITLSATDADDNALAFTAVDPPHGSLNTLTPSANCSALNTCTAQVTYTPDGNYNGADSFSFKVNDGTANSADATVSITVTAANDAPVLDASRTPQLVDEDQDDPAPVGVVGTPVSNLVDRTLPSGGVDNVSDPDSGAVLGIAITATAGAGTWWYSTNDGTNWTSFTTPTNSAARLVAAAGGRIYYQPSSGVSGTLNPAVTFRAWDTTSGTNGGTADTSISGGTTAFSATTDTANLTVNPPPTVSLDANNSGGIAPNWQYIYDHNVPSAWARVADANDATVTSATTVEITKMTIAITGAVDDGYSGIDGYHPHEYLVLCGTPLALVPDPDSYLPGDNGYLTNCPSASPDHTYYVGITGTTTGTLTVTIFPSSGTADSDARWSNLLREMQYYNDSPTPTTGARKFTITVTNGTATSNAPVSTVTVLND